MTRSFRDPVLFGDADDQAPHRTDPTSIAPDEPAVDDGPGEGPVDSPLAELFVDDPFDEMAPGEPRAELVVDDPLRSPLPPSVLPPGTEHRRRWRSEQFRRVVAGPLLRADASRRPMGWLLAALALVAELAVAVVALSTQHTSRPAAVAPAAVPSARSSFPIPDRAASVAVTWARRSLSRESVIVADPATAAALRRAGFARASDRAGSAGPANVDYLIEVASRPATDAAGVRDRSILQARSLPLAVFGTALDTVVAREVFPTVAARVRAQGRADADLRRRAGRELLRNPRLSLDPAVRALLRAGALDLRAATVLSALASTDQVAAVEPVLDPAERRAGRPVRSLAVVTSDQRATQAVLAAIREPYRPDTAVLVSPRKLRLTWMPAVAPAPSAGG